MRNNLMPKDGIFPVQIITLKYLRQQIKYFYTPI